MRLDGRTNLLDEVGLNLRDALARVTAVLGETNATLLRTGTANDARHAELTRIQRELKVHRRPCPLRPRALAVFPCQFPRSFRPHPPPSPPRPQARLDTLEANVQQEKDVKNNEMKALADKFSKGIATLAGHLGRNVRETRVLTSKVEHVRLYAETNINQIADHMISTEGDTEDRLNGLSLARQRGDINMKLTVQAIKEDLEIEVKAIADAHAKLHMMVADAL